MICTLSMLGRCGSYDLQNFRFERNDCFCSLNYTFLINRFDHYSVHLIDEIMDCVNQHFLRKTLSDLEQVCLVYQPSISLIIACVYIDVCHIQYSMR